METTSVGELPKRRVSLHVLWLFFIFLFIYISAFFFILCVFTIGYGFKQVTVNEGLLA